MPRADPDPIAWLKSAAAPGRRALTLAAASQTLETVFLIFQWAALAWIAQGLLFRRTQAGWAAVAVLFGAGLVAGAAAWGAARLEAEGRLRISRAMRQRLVAALLPSGQRRADPDAATASMVTIELTDDIADYHAQALPQRVSGPASMVVIFLVTAVVLWPAALILLFASLLIPPNMRLAGLFAKEGAHERLAASTRLGTAVLDSFRGLRTLHGIGAVARRRDELAEAAARLNATTMAVVRRAALSGTVMEVVITFSIAVDATYIGLSLLGYLPARFAPTVTLFSGLLALLLCPMYFQPLRAMAAGYHSRERALSAASKIVTLLARQESMPDAGNSSAKPLPGPVMVLLEDTTQRFQGSEKAVLHRVNLRIESGRWTAVIGPSGSGKTTLLSLIAGVRQPSSGTVRWVTPTGSSPPCLGACAWIGQQTVLLPGSIGDNIRIGRPMASPAEVEDAVAAAGLSSVVARLPQGLETNLGEEGRGLSTGEARRIAIARAFLLRAELWILDEPTAHLDSQAEAQVIAALQNATRGRTVIVATHSRALAQSVDTVVNIAGKTAHVLHEAISA